MAYKSSSEFEIICELGRGGFGVAKLARSKADRGVFVLKEVNVTLQRKILPDKLIELSRTEHQKLETLRHSNIVQVFSSFEGFGEELCVMVMEYCDGGDLQSAIDDAKESGIFFEEPLIQLWLRQIVSALKFLHDRDFVHRDIKPRNIFLLANRETVRLGDFGLLRDVDGTTQSQSSLTKAGTWQYCSPQWHDERPYTKACDVWSLGVTLYQIGTLKLPFPSTAAIITRPPEPFPEKCKIYSEELRCLILLMLQKDVDIDLDPKRPTIGEVLDDHFLTRNFERPGNSDKTTAGLQSEISTLCLRKSTLLLDNEQDREPVPPSAPPFPVAEMFTPELMSELKSAVWEGNLAIVKAILNRPDFASPYRRDLLLQQTDQEGDGILHWAAFNGHLSVVKFLVEEGGIDVEVRGFCNRTPLMAACSNGGHLNVVRYLVEVREANLDAKETEFGGKAIHLAAQWGNSAVVSYLLDKKPDFLEERSSKRGRTPFLHAVSTGNMQVADFLSTKRHANIMAVDYDGASAFHLAKTLGDPQILSYLLGICPR